MTSYHDQLATIGAAADAAISSRDQTIADLQAQLSGGTSGLISLGCTPLQGSAGLSYMQDYETKVLLPAGLLMDRHFETSVQNQWLEAGSAAKAISDAGHTLILSTKLSPYTWTQVASGTANSYLTARANECKALGKPIFVCFHHEAEGEVGKSGFGSAADYVGMWRKAVGQFRAAGATNVRFAWIQSGWSVPLLGPIYPGDDVVDVIGQDPYCPQPWLNTSGAHGLESGFSNHITNFADWAHTNHPTKPQMIAEWGINESHWTGTASGDGGTLKASMIGKFGLLLDDYADIIKYVVHFNGQGTMKVGSVSVPVNWKVDSTTTALNAMKSFVANGRFAS